MRPMFLFFLLTLILLPVTENAQENELRKLQKKIESDLFKHTPDVKKARFDECLLSIDVAVTSDGKIDPTVGSVPSAIPTEGIFNSSIRSGESPNMAHFAIDLAKIDGKGIILEAMSRKDRIRMVLSATTDDAISGRRNAKPKYLKNVDVIVNSGSAVSIIRSFRDVIAICAHPH